MIKNVTGITGDSEKSELDVMTFDDVIGVANERRETRCGSGYKYRACTTFNQLSSGHIKLNT